MGTFTTERQIQKEETLKATNTRILEEKLNVGGEARKLSTKPIPPPSRSPLLKIFAAVKSGGSTLKRKMSSMGTSKKPKVKIPSPRNRPKPSPTVMTGTTPRAGPSRKLAPPPPPPPVPVVGGTKTKKKTKRPQIKSLFHRSSQQAKADEFEDSSEAEDGMSPAAVPPARGTLESSPMKSRASPTPKFSDYIVEYPQAKPTGKKGVSFRRDQVKWVKVGEPEEESQVITARKFDIQRKAEKEIKLSRSRNAAESLNPQTSSKPRRLNRQLSSEFGNKSDEDHEGDTRMKELHSSPANGDKELTFDLSVSSISNTDSNASSSEAPSSDNESP